MKTARRYSLAAATAYALIRVSHNEDINIKNCYGLKYATYWSAKFNRYNKCCVLNCILFHWQRNVEFFKRIVEPTMLNT